MSDEELLKLTWNGHSGTFLSVFENLRSKAKYTDVTLACEGKLFAVHRLVLASCSQFFDNIFEQTPSESTVIVLNESKSQDIKALIGYMYSGQVEVPQNNLTSFLNTASSLQIKGLTNDEHGGRILLPGERTFEPVITPHKKRKNETQESYKVKQSPPKLINFAKNSSALELNNSCSEYPKAIPEDPWSHFQRSDLPNTTWSSSCLAKEKQDDLTKGYDGEAHEKTLPLRGDSSRHPRVSDGTSSVPMKGSFHRVPETRAIETSVHVKEEFRKQQRAEEESINYVNDSLEYKKETIKDEYGEILNDEHGYENGNSYAASPDIYEHYDPYPDTYEGQSSFSPNRSPSATRRHPSVSAMKFAPDQNNSVPASVWDNSLIESNGSPGGGCSSHSTVSPKLMPFAKCSNCETNNTKLWRRNMKGDIVCNACGLYFKLHGINRPSHLFRNAPMTRRRNPRKKKKSYEHILDAREQSLPNSERNDSYYNDGGCDSDTQEGLAVLNAALTLNSLFAKAKAQEAKNHNSVSAPNFNGGSSRFESPSSSPVPGDSLSTTPDTRLPPPLLKLPMRPPSTPFSSSVDSQELSMHSPHE